VREQDNYGGPRLQLTQQVPNRFAEAISGVAGGRRAEDPDASQGGKQGR
jgi:hypothetical protein